MEHTPGPWEVKEHSPSGAQIFAKVDIGNDDMSGGILQPLYDVSLKPSLQVDDAGGVSMVIAYEGWRQFPTPDFVAMQRANARLIAAAPELLETLRTIIEAVNAEDYGRAWGVGNGRGHDVLAKATGGD